jgi:hypothetical protein
MKARILIVVTLVTLAGGTGVTIYNLGRESKAAIDRYKPMAEKLRTHCHYVASQLRADVQELDAGAKWSRLAAASDLDVFVRSTEQLDVCLDNLAPPMPRFDNMRCVLGGMGDDAASNQCRRDFVKYYLDTIPERFQKFEPID